MAEVHHLEKPFDLDMFQKNGAKKVKKRNVLAKERTRKGENDFDNFHLRQQLDTIVNHQNKHTIEDQGCSWTTHLNNCLNAGC